MATNGTVDSVLLSMSHASTFFCSLVIPHTKHRFAHIHQQSTHIYTHYFHVHISPFRAPSPLSRVLERGEGWCTPPVSIGPDSCRFSGLDTPSFPSMFVLPPAFVFGSRFWFIYSRCGLVRPHSYQLSRLLHLLYNVYLFLDVRYALYSSTHSHSLPLPLLLRLFLPSIGIIEMVFVASFRCEKQKHILMQRFFLGVPLLLGGSNGCAFLDTLLGSGTTYFHMHLFDPPFLCMSLSRCEYGYVSVQPSNTLSYPLVQFNTCRE